jgi:dTDP-glucose pyrophosphorylase
MNILIPLGGLGERFKKEGYNDPKPLIKVLNKEILFHVLDNLDIQQDDKVFIIYNKDLDDHNFSNIIKNKYQQINLIKLLNNTKGAAETVFIGTQNIIQNHKYNEKTILIDGDTFYLDNILEKYRNIKENAVFYTKNYDTNPVFSYITLDNNSNIIEIKEKNKISDNANTGAYAFNNINILLNYSKYVTENDIRFNNECYTSCIIDEMIKKNEPFKGIELNEKNVIVLGTPKQVNEYLEKNKF